MSYPAKYGGSETDILHTVLLHDRLAEVGSGGLLASLLSHGIAAPLLCALGSDELKVISGSHVLIHRQPSCLL